VHARAFFIYLVHNFRIIFQNFFPKRAFFKLHPSEAGGDLGVDLWVDLVGELGGDLGVIWGGGGFKGDLGVIWGVIWGQF
jgi:hypothetical protein